jgi:16S rRNA (cytosine1407-C5)-methyltransferase
MIPNATAIAPLPPEFIERLCAIVPRVWQERVLASFQQPRRTAFRINTLALEAGIALQEMERAGIRPEAVAWCDHAFHVAPEDRARLTHHELASNGAIYVQGLSSILASLILHPQPGENVMDLAAAPGGKATHMAALMNNQGWLSVVEPIRKRMFVLADNLKRAGVTISHTYLMDGRRAGPKVPGRFDRVMLDAPCSGESRFHIEQPASWKTWSLRKIREQARKQQGLIQSAFESLRPGGRLLYGTCSFAPEENEVIVDGLLNELSGEARLLPIELPFDHWQPGLLAFQNRSFHPELALARRVLPNACYDGFFMALIGKGA